MNRKIDLPDYCCPMDLQTMGGNEECDHDYPPESKVEHDTYLEWQCSKCNMRTTVGVYD